jgi:hypothetical protein
VDVAEPGDVVAMMVMAMMVAADILVRLRRDRRGDHGRNNQGGT